MATFRKRRSMKYRNKNTRRTKNRRNARKSHIKRRSKKSLVVGGGLLRFMKMMSRSRSSNSVPSSILPDIKATDMRGRGDLVIEDIEDTEDTAETKKIKQFIKEIEAEIQKTANPDIDTYLADDTTSLKDVVSNIKTTSAHFKSQFIELVSFVTDKFRPLLIRLSNDIHDLLINTLTDFERANISQKQGIAKRQLYTFANSHYEQLIRMSEMLLVYID